MSSTPIPPPLQSSGSLPVAVLGSNPGPQGLAVDVQAALTFARTLAQDELSAIDRLHQRTVRYILAVVSVLLLAGGVVGWLGFKNLKDSAITVAQKQVRSETIAQVHDQLTRENLNEIVAAQVDGFTRHQLTSEVNHEINEGPLHDQIIHNAREQSEREVSAALAPRKLTEQQARQLVGALKDDKEAFPRLVFITSLTYDVESQDYEAQITKAFKAGDFMLGIRNNLTTPDRFSYGVTIVYDQAFFERYHLETPRKLLTSFQASGIKTVLFPGKEINSESESILPVMTIWIGPREVSHTK